MYLIFDTETTGLPKSWSAPVSQVDNWPRAVQLAFQLHDKTGRCVDHFNCLIYPDGFDIPFESEQVHGISTQLAQEQGISIEEALKRLQNALERATHLVGHNVNFDIRILGAEFYRLGWKNSLLDKPVIDTCTEETALVCKLPGGRGGKFKLPTLAELYEFLFQTGFIEAHNASADVEATARCFFELIRIGHYNKNLLGMSKEELTQFLEVNKKEVKSLGLTHQNLKTLSEALASKEEKTFPALDLSAADEKMLDQATFAHLHTHTQFSILQSTVKIKDLVQLASEQQMPAIAITDHSNLMGVFHFVKEIQSFNKVVEEQGKNPIKPIIGCEFYICEDHQDRSRKDLGYQVVFLAKNKNGYRNLCKMSSLAYTDGFYYVPRIDREIVRKYKEDLIVLTGNLYGEIPSKILNQGESQAEEALQWWKDQFEADLYLELMRHGQEDEDRVNAVLLDLSRKLGVKIVATNNVYYLKKEDSNAHDILLCIKDGEKQATPIGRGRGYRYGLPNQEYYFKSPVQMKALFRDIPEAIHTIQEIIDKVEVYSLMRDILLPKFDIPQEFKDSRDEHDGTKRGENSYLRHLTYQGAEQRYGVLSEAIRERIDFELEVIEKTGYPGYFLIIQDLIAAAKRMGVSVGPGRGSAAGSSVAYCLGITNLDPIKYNLLFERFLNPDRVSLPDIDIDFDDEGRGKIMEYVIQKYGANQVAQIITYGTMAAKSSIRDTARVLDLPLSDADKLAKLMPNAKLNEVLLEKEEELKQHLRSDEWQKALELRKWLAQDNLSGQTLSQALVLEGSIRNTGIHACGVIITPDDITEFVPIATAKESELVVTQFDNAVVEQVGLLKMDFLGLKTLTLIKDTVKLVKYRHDMDLNPDEFPLDDKKTYELFQRGETVGIFQYESLGMQRHLKELKPTVFADLIAMNALYRPGPMEYIPSFVRRKHGEEPITYDLPEMEEYLMETYGITVYQEQVMLLSQKLADFTRGEADLLRKAMGKKIHALLAQLKPKFIEGGKTKGHPESVLEKIWRDWEAFASYAFNKSHSTCYAYIAYQTAYLKAHYPAEYMAAVLSNNMNDIKQVSFFLEECRRMGLTVLGPDVNESFFKFTVNADRAIRFGMGAVKGVGKAAVDALVAGRKDEKYKSIFDLTSRVDLRAANKKTIESLILAGGMDSFGAHRAQYFYGIEGIPYLEKAIRFGALHQEYTKSAQVNLFDMSDEEDLPEPELPECEPWNPLETLKKEKEVLGIYISGHPLDDFKRELEYFGNGDLALLADLGALINKEVRFGGIITDVQHRTSKNGKGWALFTVEDYKDVHEFKIFGEEYLKFKHLLTINCFVFMKILVREGWINKDSGTQSEPRLQYLQIQLLQDVMDQYTKKLTLHLSVSELEEKRIQKIRALLKTHKGESSLHIVVFESKEHLTVTMESRKHKIRVSNELLDTLQKEQIHFKLN